MERKGEREGGGRSERTSELKDLCALLTADKPEKPVQTSDKTIFLSLAVRLIDQMNSSRLLLTLTSLSVDGGDRLLISRVRFSLEDLTAFTPVKRNQSSLKSH